MKKIYFAAAIAALAFAGCSAEDEPVAPASDRMPIEFGTSIVELSRSVPTMAFAENNAVGVFGTETFVATPEVPTPDWMNNMELKMTDAGWTYTGTKTFVKGYKYSFAAYAPYDATVTDITAIDYTASATLSEQKDLMYASAVNKDFSTTAPTAETATVKLAFNHALVQVKFSAKTAADYSAYYKVQVTGVKLQNILSKGTLNGKTGVWSTPTLPIEYAQTVNSVELKSSGYTSLDPANNEVLMLIPQTLAADSKVVMTVKITNLKDNTEQTKDVEIAFAAGDRTWVQNNVYRYQATLNLNALLGLENAVFSNLSVNPWGNEIPKEI